jgi:hypothetical protein
MTDGFNPFSGGGMEAAQGSQVPPTGPFGAPPTGMGMPGFGAPPMDFGDPGQSPQDKVTVKIYRESPPDRGKRHVWYENRVVLRGDADNQDEHIRRQYKRGRYSTEVVDSNGDKIGGRGNIEIVSKEEAVDADGEPLVSEASPHDGPLPDHDHRMNERTPVTTHKGVMMPAGFGADPQGGMAGAMPAFYMQNMLTQRDADLARLRSDNDALRAKVAHTGVEEAKAKAELEVLRRELERERARPQAQPTGSNPLELARLNNNHAMMMSFMNKTPAPVAAPPDFLDTLIKAKQAGLIPGGEGAGSSETGEIIKSVADAAGSFAEKLGKGLAHRAQTQGTKIVSGGERKEIQQRPGGAQKMTVERPDFFASREFAKEIVVGLRDYPNVNDWAGNALQFVTLEGQATLVGIYDKIDSGEWDEDAGTAATLEWLSRVQGLSVTAMKAKLFASSRKRKWLGEAARAAAEILKEFVRQQAEEGESVESPEVKA